MTLSNQQRDSLYSYVAKLLSESIQDTRDPSIVDAVMREIASVTHKAMDDVVETWNRKACGHICRLPVELLAQCFSWLDPAQRAKLTGISRYIRSVVLGQPSLWAQIELYEETPQLQDAFALALERSGRATLDVLIFGWTKDITDQIAPHIPRMRTLTLYPAQFTAWIFEQPAPLLEVLKIEAPTSAYVSPHTVLPSSTWAPRLRRLQLPSTFVLQTFSGPFDHITYFSGHMTAKGAADTDARRLFEFFPSLEVLKLSSSISTSVHVHNMPNTRLPRNLVDLRLHCGSDGHAVLAFLAMCQGHPLKHVYLECHIALLWNPIMEHMRSVASAELWHFDRGVFRLDNGAVYRTYSHLDPNLTDLRTNFDRLASIVLEARDLQKQLVEVFRMPALHSIILHAPFWGCDWNDNDYGGLCVPGLQVLCIKMNYYGRGQREEIKECFQYAEELVRRLTLEDGSPLPKIPRLVLSTVEGELLGAGCWTWIHSHVSSVYLDDELLWQQADSVA